MSWLGLYFWNVFLWPLGFLFTAAQICSANSLSNPSFDSIDKPSVRDISRREVKAFAFQILSDREGLILYSQGQTQMRWELEIRQVANDKNGEIEIASSLRRIGQRAFPITLKALVGGGAERHHYREVFDRILHEYNRKKRGRKKNELQISQDSVVVASYYHGGKNKVTKEFYLFVTRPSGEINLWVVSRSGMGNEKFELGKLELSRTSRPFERPQGTQDELLVSKEMAARFAKSALASDVGKYFVSSGRNQIRLVLNIQGITWNRNGEMELKAGIGLAGGGIQNIDFGLLPAAGEFYDTYKAYYKEERLKRENWSMGFVDPESMVYVGKSYFRGRDDLTKIFYLIIEWPTEDIKIWIVSKKDSGIEKIEKVYLRKFPDGCQEFLSNENK